MSTLKTKQGVTEMEDQQREVKIRRYRALAMSRALHETVVVNLEKVHGAVLTGLGNEAAPVGVLLAMMENMDSETFLFSPIGGDQRSMMAIAAMTDLAIESEHDHSYMILRNHLLREGVEDGNVHWGCLEHGVWHFFSSDMMRPISLIAGGSLEVRRYLEKPVGVYFFGEGASSQGVAHEVFTWLSAQNYQRNSEQLQKYAGMPLSDRARSTGVLRPVPMIACMQINHASIYTDEIDEHGGRQEIGSDGKSGFAKWAESYGIRGVDVDGDDLEAVMHETNMALTYAQDSVPKPTLLLLHMEMRRTGHNEHQINRSPESRKNRDWGQGEILRIDPEEFRKAWESEPLKRYREYLTDLGVASEGKLLKILEEEREAMNNRWDRAFSEPPATFEHSVKKRSKKNSMFAPHEWSLPSVERPKEEMFSGGTTTERAFLHVMEEFLEADAGVLYSGEDVGSGGVLVPTRRLQQKFGPERVFDAPIGEEAILGTMVGAGIARWILRKHGVVDTPGTKFCEAQFMPFNGDWQVLMKCLAPNWYQKNMPIQFVAIEHYGVVHGGGSGHYHSDCREGDYMNMPGIAIVCPSDAFDYVGLMRAAYESEWPVVFMSSIWSYGEQECAAKIPEEKYLIPIGKAAVKREGKDITVITYGNCVRAALHEAEFLAEDGIDVEVVDLRSLQPLDMETIANSVRKTGRVVVMSEASPPVVEMIIGRIVSNPEMRAALLHTVKPRKKNNESEKSMKERVTDWIKDVTGDLFKKFSVHDLDAHNRAPRVMALSRDETPIACAEDIEWNDLPFEQYVVEFENARGETVTRKQLRSVRLSAITHEMMRY